MLPTLARSTIQVTASFDTLTQQYTLTRSIDDGPPETSTTDRIGEMEKWMTEVRRAAVALPAASRGGGAVAVHVRTLYDHDFLLWLFSRPLQAVDTWDCR